MIFPASMYVPYINCTYNNYARATPRTAYYGSAGTPIIIYDISNRYIANYLRHYCSHRFSIATGGETAIYTHDRIWTDSL